MTNSYGICRLPLAPLRAEPSDRSEMVSQLMFGEHFTVQQQSSDGKWMYIENQYDGYQAWLDTKQYHLISGSYFQQINSSDFQITTDLLVPAKLEGEALNLVLGSILPLTSMELFPGSALLEFHGNAKPLSQKLRFSMLKEIALKYLNTPYLWGGKSPWGIDCSGFVQMVYRISGYQLPRDAFQQCEQGSTITSLEDCRPGDLAFFISESGKINHVGIILEDDQIIHASGKVRIDRLLKEGISVNDQITHKAGVIKRILK